jgi:hypothetical protein
MSMRKINITVLKETHGRLKLLGAKDESFDTIIQRLLDFYEKQTEARA